MFASVSNWFSTITMLLKSCLLSALFLLFLLRKSSEDIIIIKLAILSAKSNLLISLYNPSPNIYIYLSTYSQNTPSMRKLIFSKVDIIQPGVHVYSIQLQLLASQTCSGGCQVEQRQTCSGGCTKSCSGGCTKSCSGGCTNSCSTKPL